MTAKELWELSPDEFNQWRIANDLKDLFALLKKNLPHFEEWLSVHGFTVDFILNTHKPGSFFYWDSETILLEHVDGERTSYLFVPIEDESHDKRLQKIIAADHAVHFRFQPYFFWAKQKMKTDKIVATNYHSGFDTFRYVSTVAPDVPEASRTTIAPGYTVLKLGGTKIDGWGNTTFRNLDFTDLDFLEVEGEFHMNRELEIFYASCRHLNFVRSNISFTKFYGCHFEKLRSTGSRFYWSEFYRCDLFSADFENSSLLNFMIEDSSATNFSFNRVEVDNLKYTPPKKEFHTGIAGTYKTVAENYKRLRVLFQNNGHRKEASEAYYHERRFEMKYDFESIDFRKLFPMMRHHGLSYSQPAIIEQLRTLGAAISSWFSFSIWGFGERPFRTALFSLTIIALYAVLYCLSDISKVGGDFVNSLYVSTIMFTTLGFGDFLPFESGSYKLLLSTEALLGAFTFGLFIAGYANKAKY